MGMRYSQPEGEDEHSSPRLSSEERVLHEEEDGGEAGADADTAASSEGATMNGGTAPRYTYEWPAPQNWREGTRATHETRFMIPLHVTTDGEGLDAVSITPLEGTDVIKRVRDLQADAGGCTILASLDLCGAYNPLPVDVTLVLRGLGSEEREITLPKYATGHLATQPLYRHQFNIKSLRTFGNLRLAAVGSSPYSSTGTYAPAPPTNEPASSIATSSSPAVSPPAPPDACIEVDLAGGGRSGTQPGTEAEAEAEVDVSTGKVHLTRIGTDTFIYNWLISNAGNKLKRPVSIIPVSPDDVMVSTHSIREVRQVVYDQMIRGVEYVDNLSLQLAWKRSEEDLGTIKGALEDPATPKPIVLVLFVSVKYVHCSRIIYI